MTDTDRAGFLSSIRASPDDDTVLLAYADWLEEREPVRPSRKCTTCVDGTAGRTDAPPYETWDCQSCTGTGLIWGPPDPSDKDRAELIRIQLDPLQGHHGDDPAGCKQCRQRDALRERERELLAANDVRWRTGPVCARCDGRGTVADGIEPDRTARRIRCADCCGSGDSGYLLRTEPVGHWHAGRRGPLPLKEKGSVWTVSVEYDRGMKVVYLHDVDVWTWAAHRWAPSPVARAICSAHPDVVSVIPASRKPSPVTGGVCWFGYPIKYDQSAVFGSVGGTAALLPIPVYRLVRASPLARGTDNDKYGEWCRFASDKDALTALGRACATWVRGGAEA